MKKIPITLLDSFAKPGRSTCFAIKAVCKDGDVLGFTTLDADITFNDTFHTVTYSAWNELRPQNIQQQADFSVDNTDLLGWFDSTLEAAVLSGKLDWAELTIYRVSYLRLALGAEVVAYGTVGEIDFGADTKSKRKVEYRSLKQQLQQVVTEQYSLTCRNQFGDERCGMPFVWFDGTVSAVGDNPYVKFTITGVAQPDDYFQLGIIEFLTGQNAGATIEVETWLASGVVQTSFLLPFPASVGDTLRIRKDCGKTEADCIAYGNIVNMRAEHLTPVQDQSLMVPGAYIKSEGGL
jgi:uncharacterized phage protein (TIGR02218 family)